MLPCFSKGRVVELIYICIFLGSLCACLPASAGSKLFPKEVGTLAISINSEYAFYDPQKKLFGKNIICLDHLITGKTKAYIVNKKKGIARKARHSFHRIAEKKGWSKKKERKARKEARRECKDRDEVEPTPTATKPPLNTGGPENPPTPTPTATRTFAPGATPTPPPIETVSPTPTPNPPDPTPEPGNDVAISSIAPATGPLSGGTQVVINGSGFIQGSKVYFGSKTAVFVVVNSASMITCSTPQGDAVGAVDVKVSNTNGTDTEDNGFSYYSGKAFYLDPDNGSLANDGSLAKPYPSLSDIRYSGLISSKDRYGNTISPDGPIKAGDTLFLMKGNHGGVDLTGFFNDAYINVSAYSGHKPVLEGIKILGGKNWAFSGLTIIGYCSNPYAIIEIREDGDHGPRSDIKIFDNRLYNYGGEDPTQFNGWGNSCRGINLWGERFEVKRNIITSVYNGIRMTQAKDVTVEGNIIDGFSNDGMQNGPNLERININGNIIMNAYKVNQNHNDCIQFFSHNDPCKMVWISNNILIAATDPNRPYANRTQGIGAFDPPSEGFLNFFVWNNLVVSHHTHGISIYDARDSIIVNNTVMGGDEFNPPPNHFHDTDIKIRDGVGNVIRNNITTGTIDADNPSANTIDSNIRVQTAAQATEYFVDWPSFDYNLNANTALIDAGNPDLSPPTDIAGNPRNGDPDVGAYELVGE